jgi:hypothetical protein
MRVWPGPIPAGATGGLPAGAGLRVLPRQVRPVITVGSRDYGLGISYSQGLWGKAGLEVTWTPSLMVSHAECGLL